MSATSTEVPRLYTSKATLVEGPSVHYTVNATDKDNLPSENTNNGSVIIDTTPPNPGDSVATVNGYPNSTPITVSLTAIDTGSGVDWNTGQISRRVLRLPPVQR